MTQPATVATVTTENMAMEFYCPRTKLSRTVALPPGLTAEEAIEYARRWQGAAEQMAGIVRYR